MTGRCQNGEISLLLCIFAIIQPITSHNPADKYIKKPTEISIGSIHLECGTTSKDSIIVVYYGDIGSIYVKNKALDEACSSVYHPELINLLEIRDRLRCGVKRFQGTDVWTVAIHVQMDKWRVTHHDKLYYVTCDYTKSKHRIVMARTNIIDGFTEPPDTPVIDTKDVTEKPSLGIGHDEGVYTFDVVEESRSKMELLLEDKYSNVVTNAVPGQEVKLRLQKTGDTGGSCKEVSPAPRDCETRSEANLTHCDVLRSVSFSKCNQIIPITAHLSSCRAYQQACTMMECESCTSTPPQHLCSLLEAYECQCRQESVDVAWHMDKCPSLHLGMMITKCHMVTQGSEPTINLLPDVCESKMKIVGNSRTQWTPAFTLPKSVTSSFIQFECHVTKCDQSCDQVCNQEEAEEIEEEPEEETENEEEEERKKRSNIDKSEIRTFKSPRIWIHSGIIAKLSLGTGEDQSIVETNNNLENATKLILTKSTPTTTTIAANKTSLPKQPTIVYDLPPPTTNLNLSNHSSNETYPIPCIITFNDLLPYYIALSILGGLLLLCLVVIMCIIRCNSHRRRRYNARSRSLSRQPAKRYQRPHYLGPEALQEHTELCHAQEASAATSRESSPTGQHGPISDPTSPHRPFVPEPRPLIGEPRPHPLYPEDRMDAPETRAQSDPRPTQPSVDPDPPIFLHQTQSDPHLRPIRLGASGDVTSPMHIPRPMVDDPVRRHPLVGPPAKESAVSVSPWLQRAIEQDRERRDQETGAPFF